jgi:hypothetical protein
LKSGERIGGSAAWIEEVANNRLVKIKVRVALRAMPNIMVFILGS